jgi:hypothetical protein
VAADNLLKLRAVPGAFSEEVRQASTNITCCLAPLALSNSPTRLTFSPVPARSLNEDSKVAR